MKTMNESDYFSDFADFNRSTEGEMPPSSLSFKIRDQIKSDLQPDLKIVILNLFTLHLIAGGITLLICPQFGVGPLGGGDGIAGFVMKYGHVACGLFCGSFFVSFTTFLSWFLLRREVQRVMKQSQWIVYPLLALLSFFALAIFSYMANGELPYIHTAFTLPWFVAFIFFPIVVNYVTRPSFET